MNVYLTERMLAVGLALGPFGHLWYSKLVDRLVPGVASTQTALKKILADQIVAGPFFCSAFFFGKLKYTFSLSLSVSVSLSSLSLSDSHQKALIRIEWCD